MKKLLAAASVLAALAFASSATASNWPDSRLDALASQVAGHPTSVYCEDDDVEWAQIETQVLGADVWGFTRSSDPTFPVAISPQICETWHVLLANSYIDTGDFWTALAIHTLVHESVHQRGISDEGVADCTALQLDPGIDAQFVPPTMPQTQNSVVGSERKRRVVSRQVSVPNPDYQRVIAWQHQLHQNEPAQYQGGCS